MGNKLESLVGAMKSKVKALKKIKSSSSLSSKKKKNMYGNYMKMEKSGSVKVAFRSKKGRKLIDKTLEEADIPGKSSI
ncbi:hypothetical protein BVRB_9g222760 [Beta vulgaris subsp. vulgaris]|nr:hypothetical protein BVRB_9g222760 [Beta vulgaris subsp. vulgaris]